MFAKMSVESLAALERHLDNEPTAQLEDATTHMHEQLLTAAGRFGRLATPRATPRRTLNIRGDDMFHLGSAAHRKFFDLYRSDVVWGVGCGVWGCVVCGVCGGVWGVGGPSEVLRPLQVRRLERLERFERFERSPLHYTP